MLTLAIRKNAKRHPSIPNGCLSPMLVAKKPPAMPPAMHQSTCSHTRRLLRSPALHLSSRDCLQDPQIGRCMQQACTAMLKHGAADSKLLKGRQAGRTLTKIGCEEEQSKGPASGGRGVHVCYQGLHTRNDKCQAEPIPCAKAHCLHKQLAPSLNRHSSLPCCADLQCPAECSAMQDVQTCVDVPQHAQMTQLCP